MTLVIVSSIARAVAAICFKEVVMTKMMSAAAAAYLRYSEGFMTCVDIKVRAPYAIDATRVRQTRSRVVSFSILSRFG